MGDIWAAGVVAFMIICGGRHPFILTRNGQSVLDMDRLLHAEMQFTESRGFFSLSFMSAKDEFAFSEDAQLFCRQLVNKDVSARPLAGDALQHRWMRISPASPEVQRSTAQ